MIPRNVQITLVLLLVATFGSGLYLLRLHRRTEANIRRASSLHAIAPPISGSPEKVMLTIAYDDDGVFRSREASAVLPSEAGARERSVGDPHRRVH